MRFMMIMLPNVPGIDEESWTPDPEAVTAMGKYNEELSKAGVLLALDGLHSPAKGARVSFSDGHPSVTDGPFAEAKELIGGYWMIEAASKEEAVRVGLALPGGRRRHDRGAPGLRDVGLPTRGAGGRPALAGPARADERALAGRSRAARSQAGAPRAPIRRCREPAGDRGGVADRGGKGDRAARADRGRRGTRGGHGAGRARGRARALAALGRAGEPGRLADGHGQEPRDRPVAPPATAGEPAGADRARARDRGACGGPGDRARARGG